MSSRLAIALVGAVFLVTLLIRLPAGWATGFLPAGLSCSDPEGTVWRGSCGQLQVNGIGLSDLHWTLHAASLLRGRARVDVQSNDPRAAGTVRITLERSGDAEISSLSASLPLQGGLIPMTDGFSGQVELQIAHAILTAGHLQRIEGTARVLQLALQRPAASFGDFEIDFPEVTAGPMTASLRDLRGPVSLRGSLELNGNAYKLDALVAARDGSDPQLGQMLQMLGPADEQGRHVLSIAGTY